MLIFNFLSSFFRRKSLIWFRMWQKMQLNRGASDILKHLRAPRHFDESPLYLQMISMWNWNLGMVQLPNASAVNHPLNKMAARNSGRKVKALSPLHQLWDEWEKYVCLLFEKVLCYRQDTCGVYHPVWRKWKWICSRYPHDFSLSFNIPIVHNSKRCLWPCLSVELDY